MNLCIYTNLKRCTRKILALKSIRNSLISLCWKTLKKYMYTYTNLCISDLFIKYKKYEFCRPREKYGIMYIKNLEIIPLVEKHQGKFHLLLLFTMNNFYFWRHFNVCVWGEVHFQVIIIIKKYHQFCTP